jgi:hypothetical protein
VSDDEWIPYATAQDILGLGRETWPRLSQALRLRRVRSWGRPAEDPDSEPREIDPALWAEWGFNPRRGWLIRPGSERIRAPDGFVEVRFSRQDVEKLARTGSLPQTSTRARTPSLAAGSGSPEGAPLEAKAGKAWMSERDVERKLPSFLKRLQAERELHGQHFNQDDARKAAEAHFRKAIGRSRFREVYRNAGLNQKGGRRRKIPPKS